MPRPIHDHLDLHRLRALALTVGASVAVAVALTAAPCQHRPPSSAVVVGQVPPDACLAVYGLGPCREHGQSPTSPTDAVAMWPAPTARLDAAVWP